MFLVVVGLLIAVSVAWAGWKFYGTIDWEEPPEPSPDLRAMHKREAELQHIQDVLTQAFQDGKLSKPVIDEFNRFCDAEIQGMKEIKLAWRSRRERN